MIIYDFEVIEARTLILKIDKPIRSCIILYYYVHNISFYSYHAQKKHCLLITQVINKFIFLSQSNLVRAEFLVRKPSNIFGKGFEKI